ncbi:hypothetical protein [Actinacidiphila reveromycinica]|uniref:hypothetical protein n=1 Tax=Actinacidiphila reveromycinica TaxID=659352 RepID=UPI001F27DB9A|nr:hypothetical protein [Streptomyces sp. SN-593]
MRGALYLAEPTGPRPYDARTLQLADPRIPWLLGGQLLVELLDYTAVDLDDPMA